MDYDFSVLAETHISKLGKSLEALQKRFINEVMQAITIINSKTALEQRSEIRESLSTIFRNVAQDSVTSYVISMNKAQELLTSYLSK